MSNNSSINPENFSLKLLDNALKFIIRQTETVPVKPEELMRTSFFKDNSPTQNTAIYEKLIKDGFIKTHKNSDQNEYVYASFEGILFHKMGAYTNKASKENWAKRRDIYFTSGCNRNTFSCRFFHSLLF